MAEAPPRDARRLGYEPSDVRVRALLLVIGSGVLVLALAAAILYGLAEWFQAADLTAPKQLQSQLERSELTPPAPRLEASPEAALARHRAREAARLGGYGWVDREGGIAGIPVERAMRLLVQRGWPEPARGPRPQPEAVQGLRPWPDWQETVQPEQPVEGGTTPEIPER